jgi:hypothetical protein
MRFDLPPESLHVSVFHARIVRTQIGEIRNPCFGLRLGTAGRRPARPATRGPSGRSARGHIHEIGSRPKSAASPGFSERVSVNVSAAISTRLLICRCSCQVAGVIAAAGR